MRPDAALVRQLAADRGFAEATVEKALCLVDVLEEVARHPYLAPRLVLKGGTALNLFCWDCPRLSVDLDLNYIGAVGLDGMQEERPQVQSALEGIAVAGGYRVQRRPPSHAAETWYLWYRSVLGPQEHVEVDLNFLMRLCLLEPEERVCGLGPPGSGPAVKVLALEELMAGKLVALLDRAAPRDLYDTYRFVLTDAPYDAPRLRQAFVFYAAVGLPRPIWEYGMSRLSRLEQQEVERGLRPVLTRGERPPVATMVEAIAPLILRLLALEPAERAFGESVLAGQPDVSRLFPDDPTLADRLTLHPALLWKVQNVLARRRRDA